MSRRHYTDKEKIEYLAEFTRSGGTAPAYCREQGLVYQTFMRWRRERNGDLELGQSAPATEFVEIDLPPGDETSKPDPGSPAVELVLGGGTILRIYPSQTRLS